MKVRFRPGPLPYRTLPVKAARLLLGGELATLCFRAGSPEAGSRFLSAERAFLVIGVGSAEPWSSREGLVSLSSQTCLALVCLPTGHLTPAWASACVSLGTEPISTGLPDPLRVRRGPQHGDYRSSRRLRGLAVTE